MKRTLEDAWREAGSYLDQALELEPEARQRWLAEIEAREPHVAAQVREYLNDLAYLQQQEFLGGSCAPDLGEATLAGQQLGAYTLDRPLGHGGMGTVWLAHRSDGRYQGQAAVKLLNAAFVGHPLERRFAREGSVLARLKHPNIAHLLDAGVAQGRQPYLVLEYVEGERIDSYCEKHHLNIKQRIRLFMDVLAAVAHAHSNLVVHRDLKPSNILVTERGVVKLLDFGVAALLSTEITGNPAAQLTQHAALGVTPGYAAPEQLLGEPVTTATDVYALGLVLFVLLVGKHPIAEGKTAAELVRLTLDAEVPLASAVATDVRRRRALRGDLDNIIAMGLRKNPAERYATVDLLERDLRAYLAFEPVSARPSSAWYRAAKFMRRHRASVVLAVAIAAMLVGAVIVTTLEMVEARQQRDEARYQARRAESVSDFLDVLLLSDGGPDRPALTAAERINVGIDLVKKQHGDDPRFAGRMLVHLGAYLRRSDQARRAIELNSLAYDFGRRAEDPELMASAQCNAAWTQAEAGIGEGRAERMADARRLLAQLDEPELAVRVECLMAEGLIAKREGNLEVAASHLLKAVQNIETAQSTHHRMYAAVLSRLAIVYLEQNNASAALETHERVAEALRRNGRANTAEHLVVQQNIAVLFSQAGEVRESLARRELINSRVRAFESEGQEPLHYVLNHAMLLLRMARPAQARQALEGGLQRARTSGNRSILAQLLLAAGWSDIELEQWELAEARLGEAASLIEAGLSYQLRDALEMRRAQLALARKEPHAARERIEAALTLLGYHTDKPDRILAKGLVMAANIALRQGLADDAERFAGDALALSEAAARGPDTSADVGEALLRLAQARITAGHGTDAKSMLERAVRCLTNGLDSDHPLTREARSLLMSGNATER